MSTIDPAVEPIAEPALARHDETRHEPSVVEERQVEVDVVRSVRFGRILIGGAIIGAALASLAAIFFPIAAEADYSLSQIMGFMLLIGAAIGLMLGAILSLTLAAVAKRQTGTAVAIQSDVR